MADSQEESQICIGPDTPPGLATGRRQNGQGTFPIAEHMLAYPEKPFHIASTIRAGHRLLPVQILEALA
jgi:hypothetical protein